LTICGCPGESSAERGLGTAALRGLAEAWGIKLGRDDFIGTPVKDHLTGGTITLAITNSQPSPHPRRWPSDGRIEPGA
jgi:hypothetical protein